MTSEELEALWRLPPARPPGLPSDLIAAASRLAGARPPESLLERARRELEQRYNSDAIDVWEYLDRIERLERIAGDAPEASA